MDYAPEMPLEDIDPSVPIRIEDNGEGPLEYATIVSARVAEIHVDGIKYRVLLPDEMTRGALPNGN
jgi:hypothetical protein